MRRHCLAPFALALTTFLFSCGGDRSEAFYPSLADAGKTDAITHGWIPDELLPHSARNIHEVHELSPSKQWCSFDFLPTEWQLPNKDFKTIDALPASLTHIPNPGVSWWPNVLRGRLDVDEIHKHGLTLYLVERPATSVTTEVLLFAIDRATGRAFFYRTER